MVVGWVEEEVVVGSVCNLSNSATLFSSCCIAARTGLKIESDGAGGGLALLKSRRSAAIVVTEAGESKTIRDFPFPEGWRGFRGVMLGIVCNMGFGLGRR